ncbi:hypothetical protein WL38_12715 [Burkholderia ubonensis]|nr:hypothetical protein WK71_10240 [Burkholderia ubonensis]KWB68290.1 hypothetical protein WL38_12715 [Burkholderia ubonensis]
MFINGQNEKHSTPPKKRSSTTRSRILHIIKELDSQIGQICFSAFDISPIGNPFMIFQESIV